MREYLPRSEASTKIHGKIITICRNLATDYAAKRHGGYKIYEDDKVKLSLDTHVSNVSAHVKLPNGETERVFSCSYHGGQVTYHKGKWEKYLDELHEKAVAAERERLQKEQEEREKKLEKAKAPCSAAADSVF